MPSPHVLHGRGPPPGGYPSTKKPIPFELTATRTSLLIRDLTDYLGRRKVARSSLRHYRFFPLASPIPRYAVPSARSPTITMSLLFPKPLPSSSINVTVTPQPLPPQPLTPRVLVPETVRYNFNIAEKTKHWVDELEGFITRIRLQHQSLTLMLSKILVGQPDVLYIIYSFSKQDFLPRACCLSFLASCLSCSRVVSFGITGSHQLIPSHISGQAYATVQSCTVLLRVASA